ncbi:MAG: isoleucine--tRNA ligase, partial [Malacoplasma sp.]
MKDYKQTLNMPTTEFEMKANLNTKEPKIQAEWIINKLEKKILQKNKITKKTFILHDGPPYANGNIHLGHALNKIIKDFIIRYKSMTGHWCKFIPGWDTHGLPIEQELQKKNGNSQANLSIVEKRKNCKNFALENVYKQIDQFRRLGLLSEFDEIYLTCDLDYQIQQLKFFQKMVSSKLVFQDLKPIYWSYSSLTALADAEIVYQDVVSDSIYLSFLVLENSEFLKKNDRLLIWTTTPWTIPSNLAIAVNPKIVYCRINVDGRHYVVAKDLISEISSKLEWKNYEIVSEFLGKKIEKVKYIHPLNNKKFFIILASYVSDSNGTGLVHNAPGFGHDDYLACKKYGIKVFCPINEYGKFTDEIKDKDLINKFYADSNPIIIEKLTASQLLEKADKIKHSAAHDWRTKKPVIYRATKQWFINVGKIKPQIIKELSKVKSVDKDVINKMKEMISNREEWCISRQRYWGVPIPIIYDKDNVPILDTKLISNIIEILNNEDISSWFRDDVKDFLTPTYNKSKKYRKEQDIMDVWFDSGVSYNILLQNKISFPADLYFEGKDQFRGWFNSSLITSVAVFNKAPYKSLLTHGFVLDENGNKMSKSLGNVVDPLDICQKYGADVLRIWVSTCNYLEDVRISNEIISQAAEMYRKIRNTLFKFILGNLNDYDYKFYKKADFNDADKYVLLTLAQNLKEIQTNYEVYDFKSIIKIVNKNLLELSSWYFDYIKDSLYCDSKDSVRRRTIQSVLYVI